MCKGKAEYMNLDISIAEAREETAYLRTQMHQKGCTCKHITFQQILNRLCKLLAYIQYKSNLEKKWSSKQGSLHPNLTPETQTQDLICPPTMRPFYKGQNNQKLHYLSVMGLI